MDFGLPAQPNSVVLVSTIIRSLRGLPLTDALLARSLDAGWAFLRILLIGEEAIAVPYRQDGGPRRPVD